MYILASENRYEGSWRNDKKNGPGRYFYLDRGQLYEGTWLDDVPKCGEMKDFGREGAPAPTQYPIPVVGRLYWIPKLAVFLSKQWTYGQTLLSWNNHFHTSEACLKPL